MKEKSTLPVISKEEQYENSFDYDFLYRQGIETISKYSGNIWTNFNDSDPGITILQTLCYALTELGFKADLPIEDILANENGEIDMHDRFYPPEEILPCNPVTLLDFKKVIIDSALEIKQVYFKKILTGLHLNLYVPFLELKNNYDPSSKTPKYVVEKIQNVLYQKGNLGQLFLEPQILEKYILELKGEVVIGADVSAEYFAAKLIFSINNLLSAYPVYSSYETLRKKGLKNNEIFDGPLLQNGFLEDGNFNLKRNEITGDEIMTTVDKIEGTELVESIQIVGEAKIFFDKAPFVNFESLFRGSHRIKIIQGGRDVVQWLSKSQVDYEIGKIMPDPQPPFNGKKYLPKGEYSNISEYYSIQHHFPEVYNLSRSSFKDKQLEGKVRQLKAYLSVFEQIMANYLSQLDQVGKLFDFNSGRNSYQVVGKTYFFNDIYDVPGIQYLLKDVKGYSKYYGEHPSDLKDWNAYKRDPLNPYRQQLSAAIEDVGTNLQRKSKVLKHLLARFGTAYKNDYLHLNNPGYGKPESAAVQHISDTLKKYPLLSGNKTRTYFFHKSYCQEKFDFSDCREKYNKKDCEEKFVLLSGMELNAGNQLNLNSYYQGLIDGFNPKNENKPTPYTVTIQHGGKRKLLFGDKSVLENISCVRAGIEVFQNGKSNFIFPLGTLKKVNPDKKSIIKRVHKHVNWSARVLCFFNQRTKGFLVVDHQRLLSFLDVKFELFDPAISKTKPLWTSGYMPFQKFVQSFLFIESDLPLVVGEKGGVYSIGVQTNQPVPENENRYFEKNDLHNFAKNAGHWYPICENIREEKIKDKIFEKLEAIRKGENNDLSIFIYDETEKGLEVPENFFNQVVSVVYPGWVSLFANEDYIEFFNNTLMHAAPAGVTVKTVGLQLLPMVLFLEAYKLWMKGIINQYEGCTSSKISKNAALQLLLLLNECND